MSYNRKNTQQPSKDIPWNLIPGALTNSLSIQNQAIFNVWLKQSFHNIKKFDEIKQIWEMSRNGFNLFSQDDVYFAWQNLQLKIRTK